MGDLGCILTFLGLVAISLALALVLAGRNDDDI